MPRKLIDKLCIICSKPIPLYHMMENLKIRRHSKRIKCYDCVPYDPKRFSFKKSDTYYCPRCRTTKSSNEFFCDLEGKRNYQYCRPCQKEYLINKQQIFKQICIDYKGGKCQICGYDKCQAAFDFHHLDPSKKDFNISRYKGVIMTDKVKDELDKCILLCANCHREKHFNE